LKHRHLSEDEEFKQCMREILKVIVLLCLPPFGWIVLIAALLKRFVFKSRR